jgi:uncharacterized protein (TIGR03067 family)
MKVHTPVRTIPALIAFCAEALLLNPGHTTLAQSPAKDALAPRVDATKDLDKSDHEKIQGTWTVVSAEDSGTTTPEADLKNLTWVITKDKITYKVRDRTTEWLYKLDPTQKTKALDLTERGRTALGIYELEGDRLAVCFPEETKQNGRPRLNRNPIHRTTFSSS